MSFARAQAARSLRQSLRYASARPAVGAARLGQTQLVARRWASTGGAHGAPSSDLPWLLTAVAVTLPSCFYLWPSATSAEHGHGHEEHAEDESEEGKKEEEQPSEEAESEKSEDAPAEQKEESQPSPAEDTQESADDKAEEGAKDDSQDESSGERKIEADPSKGVMKKRIDSGLRKDLGSDVGSPAGSDASSGDMSSKQSGLSNTATRHSTQIDQDPNKSKKSSGAPETAKASGTVDSSAPLSDKPAKDEKADKEGE